MLCPGVFVVSFSFVEPPTGGCHIIQGASIFCRKPLNLLFSSSSFFLCLKATISGWSGEGSPPHASYKDIKAVNSAVGLYKGKPRDVRSFGNNSRPLYIVPLTDIKQSESARNIYFTREHPFETRRLATDALAKKKPEMAHNKHKLSRIFLLDQTNERGQLHLLALVVGAEHLSIHGR